MTTLTASRLAALATAAAAAALLTHGTVATPAADGSAVSPAAPGTGRCAQPGPYQLPHGARPVTLDPADFTTRIDNPFWPMLPGTVWRYVETDAGGDRSRVEVTVTHRTRTIRGIEARVVHDVQTDAGEVAENTFDWYAQDAGGSIWYLGEFTREYDDGDVSTEGSWEYGVDGAQAGVIVPAAPVAGCAYREEFSAGHAVDRARVLTTLDDVTVHGARYRNALSTSDRSPLEPAVLEHKFYGRGTGPVLEIGVSPHAERTELVAITRPAS